MKKVQTTNRTKSTFLNAIVMITNTALLSFLALISTNLILKNYGSDYNGVVATANQFVNLILIVEGGFTTAINVALFKPYVDNNQKKINQIMSAAKSTFFKIGLIFFTVGLLISIVYPIFIKSNLAYTTIFLIFLMVMVGTAYNLLLVYRNQIMFQVSQKEYIYSFFATIINVLSSLTTIVLAYYRVNMLIIRLFILVYIIINGIIVYLLFKKTFPNIKSDKPDYKSIVGTKDIMIQKLTSVIYLSSPLLFISTFISTKVASVYAVYNSIYNIIKSVITSMIAAPVNGFGQLLSKEKSEYVYKKFQLYEYIIILATIILLISVVIVIIPFIKIYTTSVKDINYANYKMAYLIAFIVLFEVIHIPSGNIINVSGKFKVAKRIQLIACSVLIIALLIGGYFYGIYGVLIATLLTNISLSFMELYYTHFKIFMSNITNFLKRFTLNILVAIIMIAMSKFISIQITNYLMLLIYGTIIFITSLTTVGIVNFIFFREDCLYILNILKRFIKQKKTI